MTINTKKEIAWLCDADEPTAELARTATYLEIMPNGNVRLYDDVEEFDSDGEYDKQKELELQNN